MTYDPEVERAWERAAPVANIMLEGISLERKLAMARLRTPPVVSIDFSKWTRGILSQIDRILQSPDAFRDSIASNTEEVTRDRGRGGYPIRRGERLERTLMAIEDLGRVMDQWSLSPVEEWETLESALMDLLRHLHRFDPETFERWVRESHGRSRKPEWFRP